MWLFCMHSKKAPLCCGWPCVLNTLYACLLRRGASSQNSKCREAEAGLCLMCLRKRKKEKKKKTYVSNTVCKGESRMKNIEKYWGNWVGDRSPGAQKAVVRKLYFIPSRVGSHWRIFKQGRGIKFTIYLSLQFYFFASLDKYFVTFFSDTWFRETFEFWD